MRNNWHPKPGDRFVRRARLKLHPLRRVLGIPALYSAGYGNVGSSIYYALGIVALVAMGATPIALVLAGIFFVFTALTYAEGTAMFPEAGGSASFARYGFNDLVGFISGWALILSYIVTIAISAFVIPPYLGYFWIPLKDSPIAGTVMSMGIVFFLMVINILGVKETSLVNITAAILDLALQVFIIILGLLLVFNFGILSSHVTLYWPSWENLILAIALATIAYTGVETMSQMAEETRQPARRVPQALVLMVITVLVLFSGVSTIGLSAMTPNELASEWATDPVAGIAHSLSLTIAPTELATRWSLEPAVQIILAWIFEGIRSLLPALVGILAASILFIATNAGLMGISRLAFALGRYQLVPPILGKVHHRFKTPYVAIVLFSGVALLILIPGFFARDAFTKLGTLYAFGSLVSFFLAHASILILRIKQPELPRPFKLGWNIQIKQWQLPITAILGLLFTAVVWLIVVLTQPYSRWVGFAWMGVGFVTYFFFRRQLPFQQLAKNIVSRKGNQK